MSGALGQAENLSSSSERRKHVRQRVRSITYVDLDQGNGGIILDASESGMSVQAVVSLMDDELPKVRMKLPHSKEWIETRAQIAWTRESRKVVGLQFLDLTDETRDQIKEWLLRDASDAETEPKRPVAPSANAAKPDSAMEATFQETGNADRKPARTLIGYTSQSERDAQRDLSQAAVERPQSPARILSAPFSGDRTSFQAVELREKPSAEAPPPSSPLQKDAPPAWQNWRLVSVYLVFAVLALLSLTAGWAAGSGKFGPLVEKLRNPAPETQAEERALTHQTEQPAAPVKYIQIVDTKDQHWTVPLHVASQYREAKPAPAQPGQANSPALASNSAPNLPDLTLSAPQRSTSSRAADAIEDNPPPAVPAQPGAPQIAPPVRLAKAATAVPLPKPQVPQEELKHGKLIHRVEPKYPKAAKQAHLTGTVVLNATISPGGAVRNVSVVSGPKLLTEAAIDAVRKWRYAPTLRNGKPVETKIEISLAFQLAGGK